MRIISVDMLVKLEAAFNGIFVDHGRLKLIYNEGIYYVIAEEHLDDALDRFQVHYSNFALMQAAQFAFRFEMQYLVLIKNRLVFDDVRKYLLGHGFEVVEDQRKTRTVQPF